MGSVMASTRGNFLNARKYLCNLALILGSESSQATNYRFLAAPRHFQYKKRKRQQKACLDWEYHETVGLQAAFHFGAENWEKQLENINSKIE